MMDSAIVAAVPRTNASEVPATLRVGAADTCRCLPLFTRLLMWGMRRPR